MNPPEGPAAPASGDTDVPTFAELAADPEIAPLLDFEPVPVQPRINGWDADAQKAFIALLAITGSRRLAADAIGRKASSIERILKRDDAEALRAAHDRALALFRRNHGQMLAHSTNCAHKSVGRAAPANCVREVGHDRLPCPCRHLLVDGSIGNNLGEAFADRDIDQYPRAADRGVEVLRQELLHGALVHPGALE